MSITAYPIHCAHGIPMSQSCPACHAGTAASAADIYLDAAKALAAARVKEAEAFLRHKIRKDTTDGVARAQAIVETKSELDTAMARLEIARTGLHHT
jgi:hypothetical protein